MPSICFPHRRFNLGRDRIDPGAHLLARDVIYVGGGSMRNMLAICHRWE